MSERIVRLGLMYPEGGGEYDYYLFADAVGWRVRPLVVAARLYGDDRSHDPENLKATARIDQLEVTARSLVPLAPHSCMWACTSGSFISGRAHALAQVEAIRAVLGCPTGSTSLAFVHALEAVGARRVAVLATYPEPVARAFQSFLAESGIAVVSLEWLGAVSGQVAFLTPHERLLAAARGADSPGADALLVPDTAVGGCALIEPLESELGKPVLVANQVTLWHGLRLAGSRVTAPGYGRLMAF